MFLNSQDETLDVNFKCKYGDNNYMAYSKTEGLRFVLGTSDTKSWSACTELCSQGVQGLTQLGHSSINDSWGGGVQPAGE